MVAGCTGAIAKTITAPIDRIKVILQTQYSATAVLEGKRVPYKGIFDCIGVLSFWRGNLVNVVRYFPTQALNFSLNDYISKQLRKNAHAKYTKFISFASGGTAGAITTLVMYPLEYCQTRISADVGSDKKDINQKYYVKREFRGIYDCVSKTSKRGGIKAFYCGIGIAAMGMGFYRTLYFGLYDLVKRTLVPISKNSDEKLKLPILSGLIVAQCITIFASTFCYPFDTLGRRMMLEVAKGKNKQRFTSIIGAVKFIYTEGGIRSFYKGIFANYIKGFSGALILVLYDEITTHFYK
ncbi:hypothetical protein RN001_013482 [Aquatica leii]|uniref:ADP/ATP translocase n=1 Tax=Aquatica leii TaxID=1421715 RepID=A0AAN7P038_9COLE|nr:hypothetical protein RN001_013482 [Aquatica leii]